jgi:Leucine-rich repeat (LRR) protein
MNRIILITGVVIIASIAIFLGQSGGVSKFANNSNDNILDLSSRELKSIPSDVFDRKNLEELNVSHNLLTGSIQSQIGQLSNLKIFNASDNLMTGVPAEIGRLQKLEVLNLSNNQLTGLPNELGNLKNLKTLNLSGNQYSQQDLDYIRGKLPLTVNIVLN